MSRKAGDGTRSAAGRAAGSHPTGGLGPFLTFTHLVFASLHERWERRSVQRAIGTGLVLAFLASLVLIELRRRGILPDSIAWWVPTNHFYAVQVAFNLLLAVEVLRLVFGLSGTMGNTMGKQLEILSIILLRRALEALTTFPEPIHWDAIREVVPRMVVDTAGGVLVFVLVGVFYRIQHAADDDRSDEERKEERIRFTATREVVALVLLGWFTVQAVRAIAGGLAPAVPGSPVPGGFFEYFYTVLVFSDILILFLSLRHSFTYDLVFRNSGYAAVTVLIRLALTAPQFINVGLGVSAAVLGIVLAWAYERNAAVPRPPTALHPEDEAA